MSCTNSAVLIDEFVTVAGVVYEVIIYKPNTILQTNLVKVIRDGTTFWTGTIATSLIPTGLSDYDTAVVILDTLLQVH